MKLGEYVKNVVIGAIGGLVTTLLLEVKGMNVNSIGYWITIPIILGLITFVSYIGWIIIKKIEKKDKKIK